MLVLLNQYPDRMDALAMSLPYATVVKRIGSLLALGVPLVLLGIGSIRRFRGSGTTRGGE